MYNQFVELIEWVCKLLNLVCCPPIVERRRENFCNDNIHFSVKGANESTKGLRELITLIHKFRTSKEKAVPLQDSLWNHFQNTTCTSVIDSTNIGEKIKIDSEFVEQNYKKGNSWKSYFTYYHKTQFQDYDCRTTIYTDSLFRHIVAENKKHRCFLRRRQVFSKPCIFTVMPGATIFNLNQEITTNKDFIEMQGKSFFNLLFFGTNEMLEIFSIVDLYKCNKGVINHRQCSLCKRGKRKPHAMPRSIIEYWKFVDKQAHKNVYM